MKKILKYCFWSLVIASLAALLPDPLELKPPKQFLKLWFKPTAQGLAQLFWKVNGQYSEVESEKSTIYGKDKFISLKFMLPEKYEELRFDPFNKPGSFELKDIALVTVDDKPIRPINIQNVKASNQVEDVSIKDDVFIAQTTPDATDPSLIISDSYTFHPPAWYIRYKTSIYTFIISFFAVIILGYLADISDEAALEAREDQDRSEQIDINKRQ